jgi:hypothetical protein
MLCIRLYTVTLHKKHINGTVSRNFSPLRVFNKKKTLLHVVPPSTPFCGYRYGFKFAYDIVPAPVGSVLLYIWAPCEIDHAQTVSILNLLISLLEAKHIISLRFVKDFFTTFRIILHQSLFVFHFKAKIACEKL